MVAIRDLKCSMDIAEMAALGKFEQEFIMYGCCYLKDGYRHYRISTQAVDVYSFQENSLEQGIYCTPVTEELKRVLVPSGMQEEYELQTRIALGKKLQQMYPKRMLDAFLELAQAESDAAAPLFYDLKRKLNGCFERDILNLVESLLTYAYRQKKLTVKTYQEFMDWLQYLYSQMEDDVVIKKQFHRTFYGFMGNHTQTKKFFSNASESELYKQRERFMCKGTPCTAILKRSIYHDFQPDLRIDKQEFHNKMEEWMNDAYVDILKQIDALPTPIDTDAFKRLQAEAEAADSQSMMKHMDYYHCMWNLD